jgi:hypothetical protein
VLPRVRLSIALLVTAVAGLSGCDAREPSPEARALALRQRLFDLIQPVALTNCTLERFGEAHDGGYLMCGNLLDDVGAAYSYGIAGYDKWGCDIATRAGVRLHQYDCFDTRPPGCPTADAVFHPECVADAARSEEGRPFDTIENQVKKNGDWGKRLAIKIDVEGAEWDALLHASDATLQSIDQLAIELHQAGEERHVRLLERLRQFFHIAHLHHNNAGCVGGIEPFTSWAYELLLVNKRLAEVDTTRRPQLPHALDARNAPNFDDCQP